MDENKAKGAILSALATIFNFDFTPAVAAIYISCLEDLSFEELSAVIKNGIKANRWRFMPKPGEFLTAGETEILDDSRDAAHLVWSAIARFGRFNPREAEFYVGTLAWKVVQNMGGWESICEVKTEERGIFIAQFRDLAQSVSRRSEQGRLDERPRLPEPLANRLLRLVETIG